MYARKAELLHRIELREELKKQPKVQCCENQAQFDVDGYTINIYKDEIKFLDTLIEYTIAL